MSGSSQAANQAENWTRSRAERGAAGRFGRPSTGRGRWIPPPAALPLERLPHGWPDALPGLSGGSASAREALRGGRFPDVQGSAGPAPSRALAESAFAGLRLTGRRGKRRRRAERSNRARGTAGASRPAAADRGLRPASSPSRLPVSFVPWGRQRPWAASLPGGPATARGLRVGLSLSRTAPAGHAVPRGPGSLRAAREEEGMGGGRPARSPARPSWSRKAGGGAGLPLGRSLREGFSLLPPEALGRSLARELLSTNGGSWQQLSRV